MVAEKTAKNFRGLL